MIIQHYKLPVDIAQDHLIIKDAKLKNEDIILKQGVDYLAYNPETGLITFDYKTLKRQLQSFIFMPNSVAITTLYINFATKGELTHG